MFPFSSSQYIQKLLILNIKEIHTWRKLSPPGRSRTRCCRLSGSKPADYPQWAAGHQSPHPPILQNARSGSERSQRMILLSPDPIPDPSSPE